MLPSDIDLSKLTYPVKSIDEAKLLVVGYLSNGRVEYYSTYTIIEQGTILQFTNNIMLDGKSEKGMNHIAIMLKE